MEVLNTTQSASSIYMQLAQKRAELASIEKKDVEKSTLDSYDKTSSSSKYDEKDYERVVSKFKKLDSETKIHEQLHASKVTTTTPINYNYQVGPDGKLYATGGSVRFDTSIPKDEASANLKLQQLQDAASAPNELSGADAQIARVANLNRLLLQSQEQGVENDS
ncbi:putative metalloprotease CJM1_0395 family protein [Halarcobacter sp.]|uniref:putative metalloprotease CJM1_0395 family protein n=1 Tax=Halarcobacter sp. TaxID=2321133 RepID=UPI002AA91A39|nr:putative metalloprotease CJM1_0395 family protein [Halarcobacter sp.]